MNVHSNPSIPSRLSDKRRDNIRRLLNPRHLVLMGGRQVEYMLMNFQVHQFGGEIHIVNERREQMRGVRCYRSLAELPVVPDAAFLGVNAETTIASVTELNAMGAGGVICYASGFSEIGGIGIERNRRLIDAAGEMALVGPNCFGLVNYVNHGSMWPVVYPPLTTNRGAAVIGQSGNVCIHLSSNQRSVPFSYLISAGNQAVLGFEDYIDYLADDPAVSCIGLFMEGIRDLGAFSQACLRARAKGMPVIACRSGRSELGAAMAASHTSSLAGQNEYYDALFSRLGVIATDTVPQFLEMMKIASISAPVPGGKIAVFSSSGGDNGLAADYCSFAGLDLPQPTAAQVAGIKPLLPDFAHVANPFDFTADYWGDEEKLSAMFTTMLQGDYDCGLMVMDQPSLKADPESDQPLYAMIRALAHAGRATGKPVFMGSVNPESIPEEMRNWMIGEGVAPLQGLHDAARVIALWAGHCMRVTGDRMNGLDAMALMPYAVSPHQTEPKNVNEAESKRRLASYGLTIPNGRVLSRGDIDTLPETLPGPAVLKVLHDDLPHKTEVGGVALNLGTRADVQAAADRMLASVREHAPSLVLEDYLLEPMQAAPLAELIVGVKRDPLFGMVLVIGAGGIFVELLKDARPVLLPTSRAEIEAALRSLKTFPLLDGFRGKPRADLEPVIDAIMAIAAYAGRSLETLAELDVNPMMIYEKGVVAVDALIVERITPPGQATMKR